MAFNGSGVFNRLFTWATDKTNLVPVTASRMDSEMDGFATGLSTCILKDGTQTITAAIPWNSQNLTGVGVLTVTGSTASTTPTTGAAIITGGLGVTGAINGAAAIKTTDTTASTSTTTGSIIAGGGIGSAGRVSADNFLATNQPCFSAHKNGTNQTGIANGVFTKATFATEVFDIGSLYDTTLSRWTPPASMVRLVAAVQFLNGLNDNNAVLAIYKNGVRYKDGQCSIGGATDSGITVTIIDRANGTDYYEVFFFGSTATTLTLEGAANACYFMGSVL